MANQIAITSLVLSIVFSVFNFIYAWLRTRVVGPKILVSEPRVALFENTTGAIHTHSRNLNFHFEFRNRGDIKTILYYTVTLELYDNEKTIHSKTKPESKDGNIRFEQLPLAPKTIETKGNFTFDIKKYKKIKICTVKINGYYSDHEGLNQNINLVFQKKIEKTKINA